MNTTRPISITALAHTYTALRDDLGDLGDLPKELATTVANVYYRFFVLAENPTASGAGFDTTDSRSAIESYRTFMETHATIQSSFQFAKELIRSARDIRKQKSELFDYVVVVALDALKYNIDNATEKMPLRRAIERRFKKVDEIPNLLEIMAARALVVYSANQSEPKAHSIPIDPKDPGTQHPAVREVLAIDGDTSMTLVQLDNDYYVVAIGLRPWHTYDAKTDQSHYYGMDRQQAVRVFDTTVEQMNSRRDAKVAEEAEPDEIDEDD